ncbi:MAG: hypothetical protein A2096_04920 [Spirochaetes bacterium GWF1_41_5]|nr:MAG: hypothetical protein A2096_04920 [Spirochaetes bacterium GWF1_41_5]HBE02283.1 hypothetical protein [Spirochaetia bacterium]
MNQRENLLRCWTMRSPGRIPVHIMLSLSLKSDPHWPEMESVVLRHPALFPEYKKGDLERENPAPWQRRDTEFTDSWGAVWKTAENGITGCVIRHPLQDISQLAGYIPPDPSAENGWEKYSLKTIEQKILKQKKNGQARQLALRHGHTFLTMTYLRSFENLIFDMADETPEFTRISSMVENFNMYHIRYMISLRPDIIRYPEDLGAQNTPLLSPEYFRKYIMPGYKRLMKPALENGIIIHMHSDGYIMDLIDDLLECGIQVINLQDLVNGIDDMAKILKGRAAIDLDIDRQSITVFGTPDDISEHVRECVLKLASPAGGLSLGYGLYPGTSARNADALFTAFEKYAGI